MCSKTIATPDIIDFIRSLYPGQDAIPLHIPTLGQLEKDHLSACIDSTFVSSVGPYVTELEETLAAYTGAEYAIACVNGTAALHVALDLVGVQPGDLVITQAVSFIATANAIHYAGAMPAFVDSDLETMGMSPDALRTFLETQCAFSGQEVVHSGSGRRVAAVLPMHVFGHACRIDELNTVCEEYGVPLVEDAAEALGSFITTSNGERHLGTVGKVGAFSFNGNKTITTGGGGMVVLSDSNLAHLAKHKTTTAKVSHRWAFKHDQVGWNYRMPNINAALGVAQFKRLPELLDKKRAIAKQYELFFEGTDIRFMKAPGGCLSNYWLCAVLLPDRESRDEFLVATNDVGVMTRPLWDLLSEQPMYVDCPQGPLEVAGELADRLVNLPSWPLMPDCIGGLNG